MRMVATVPRPGALSKLTPYSRPKYKWILS
jgi:hypothetical protein